MSYVIWWMLKKFKVERFSLLRIFFFSIGIWGVIVLLIVSSMTLSYKGAPSISKEAVIPEFPWPPPAASASLVLPNAFVLGQWRLHREVHPLRRTGQYFYYYYYDEEELVRLWDSGGPRLIHVNATLTNALSGAGYYEASYYSVPDGFAVVTRLEQINSDGTPKPSPSRWETQPRRLEKFSLAEYLRALFLANPGFYRIIVFVVTPHPFTQSREVVTREEAISWLRFGANVLPLELSLQPYSAAFTCTALIYEFEKVDVQAKATIKVPGRLSAQIHIEKSGIGVALR